MKVRFLKNGAAYGFGYVKGAEVNLDDKKHAKAIKEMLEAKVIEPAGKTKKENASIS